MVAQPPHQILSGDPWLLAMGRNERLSAESGQSNTPKGAIFSRNGENCRSISSHLVRARVIKPFETAIQA
jgi:hypothetical protein